MRAKHFWLQVVCLLVCLALTNGAVRFLARNTQPRKVLRAIERSTGCTDLFLGDSMLQEALDVRAYEAAAPGRRALDAAMYGSTKLEQFLVLRRALAKLRPRRIFVGCSGTDPTNPAAGGWLVMHDNRAMSYYTDRELAIGFYAADQPLLAWQVRLVSLFPMIYDRRRVWMQLHPWRERMKHIGLIPGPKTPFYLRPPAAEEAQQREAIEACYRQVLQSRAGVSSIVLEIVRLAKRASAQIIFVRTPESSVHRRLFDTPSAAAYWSYVVELLEAEGVTWVFAQNWFNDDQFADQAHVKRETAVLFSRRLATMPLTPKQLPSNHPPASLRP